MSWTISKALMESYENSRSLPERAGESSEEYSADSAPSAPSKSTRFVVLYCAPDKTTVFSRLFPFGTILELSTEDLGAATWTSLPEASPAPTSARRTQKVRDSMERRAAYGQKCGVSLAKYDPDSHSLRIAQTSLIKGVCESLQTLPKWGMIANGVLYQLPTPERLTCVIGGGAWPTPTCNDAKNNAGPSQYKRSLALNVAVTLPTPTAIKMWRIPTANDAVDRKLAVNCRGEPLLSGQVKMYPTPMAVDCMDRKSPGDFRRKNPNLSCVVHQWPTPRTQGMCGGSGGWEALKKATGDVIEARKMGAGNGGQLNPQWVEWLMGFPIGWVNLEPLGTDKFRRFLNCFEI